MKLNNFDLVSFSENNNEATFIIENATIEEVINIDCSELKVTAANDELYRVYGGFHLMSVGWTDPTMKQISLHVAKKMDDTTAEAIEALESNIKILQNISNKLDRQLQLQEKTVVEHTDQIEAVTEESALNVQAIAELAMAVYDAS